MSGAGATKAALTMTTRENSATKDGMCMVEVRNDVGEGKNAKKSRYKEQLTLGEIWRK